MLWSACLAMLAVGANSTAIMAALPSMRTELLLGPGGVEWAVNAYLVVAAALFLNCTVYGRHLQALGRNEQAARYSGIRTQPLIVLVYVISAALAGLGGVLFVLDDGSAQPSLMGNFYELWAIAAAVLGGCSLRGGEGTILGVVIGAAVMRVLYNAINILHIPTHLEFAIIGIVILGGVSVDELIRRFMTRRKVVVKD